MHIKFVVDTQDPDTGEWSDAGEAFDTQSQAEQYILSLGEDTRTRIRRAK